MKDLKQEARINANTIAWGVGFKGAHSTAREIDAYIKGAEFGNHYPRPELSDQQRLDLGIEIVAAMKASLHDWDIEAGRIDALSETEIDRMIYTPEEMSRLSEESKETLKNYAKHEKARLHNQALFAADIVLKKLASINAQ